MREAAVFYKGEEAGVLTQHDEGSFTFRYHDRWMSNEQKPAISLTLRKSKQTYQSDHLFSFFYNMLPEGINKQVVCKHMRIDEDDHFGLLITTATHDTIGAITVRKIEPKS